MMMVSSFLSPGHTFTSCEKNFLSFPSRVILRVVVRWL
jgi:hypothetical protein